MASSFLSLVDFLVMMLNVTTIQMCSVTCWPYKSVSVNVGPDSVIHTCAEQIRNLPDQNSPVNCSHKQAARLHRAKPVVLLVQYQSLAEDASTPWASVLLHLFVPGVNLSYWLVEKTFPLNQSVLGLLVLCSMYLCRKWYFFFLFFFSYCSFLQYVHGIRHYDSCHNTIVSHLFNNTASVLCHSSNVLNSFYY